jgi:hypothetical protein
MVVPRQSGAERAAHGDIFSFAAGGRPKEDW